MNKVGLAIAGGAIALAAAFAAPAQAGSKNYGFGGKLGIGPGSFEHKDPPTYNAPSKQKTYKRKSTKKQAPTTTAKTPPAKSAPAAETDTAQYDIEHSSITSESGDVTVSAQAEADAVDTGSTEPTSGCKRYIPAAGQTITVPCD